MSSIWKEEFPEYIDGYENKEFNKIQSSNIMVYVEKSNMHGNRIIPATVDVEVEIVGNEHIAEYFISGVYDNNSHRLENYEVKAWCYEEDLCHQALNSE